MISLRFIRDGRDPNWFQTLNPDTVQDQINQKGGDPSIVPICFEWKQTKETEITRFFVFLILSNYLGIDFIVWRDNTILLDYTLNPLSR